MIIDEILRKFVIMVYSSDNKKSSVLILLRCSFFKKIYSYSKIAKNFIKN